VVSVAVPLAVILVVLCAPHAVSGQAERGAHASAPPTFALVLRLLESATVEVIPDRAAFAGESARPIAGYAVSEFQARSMAAEIAGDARGGVLGADLDDIAPLPAGSPPVSYLVAAWLALGSTPAARASAELVGPQDWKRAPFLVYPSVVLAAFVGDAIRHAEPDTSASTSLFIDNRFERPPPARFLGFGLATPAYAAEVGGPCSAINAFVDQVLANVFNKIKIQGGSGVGGFFAGLFNKAVDLVGVAVKGIVKTITAPIAEGMRVAIGIVGVVSYAGSLLKPWSLVVTADPKLIDWSIDGQPPHTGGITARPSGVWLPSWPPELVACAQLVGLNLPATNADVGSPVQWIGAGPGLSMIQRTYRDETLPADGVAKYAYEIVKSETRQEAEQGRAVDATLTIEVHLQRKLVKEMQKFLENLFLGSIPALAAPVLKPIIAPTISSVLGKLAKLLRVNGSTQITIRRHMLSKCPLFTLAEAEETLGLDFDTLALIPPTGCAVGTSSGPKLGYYYSDASCQLARSSVALVGVTDLDLGPFSFYLHSGDSHVLGFPSKRFPNKCVLISASPLGGFRGGRIKMLAEKMRPRS
jgi:hypothetical protein